jgi:hypothetical protein
VLEKLLDTAEHCQRGDITTVSEDFNGEVVVRDPFGGRVKRASTNSLTPLGYGCA